MALAGELVTLILSSHQIDSTPTLTHSRPVRALTILINSVHPAIRNCPTATSAGCRGTPSPSSPYPRATRSTRAKTKTTRPRCNRAAPRDQTKKHQVPAPHGNGGGRAAPRRPTRTPAAHRNEADTLGFAFSTGKRSERSRAAKNTPGVGVNFDKLERSTLEKISKTHYEDESLPDDPRKSKLVEHIADHFVKEKCPDENEVLLAFIKALAGSVPKSDKDPATEETR
jgi:hypothetical protein